MLPGNLGGGELLVILLIALLVLGPDKLPSAARNVGKALTEFRRMSAGFQAELRDALQEPVTGVPKAASSTEATHALPTAQPEPTTPAAETAKAAETTAPTPARRRRERPLQAERAPRSNGSSPS